MPVGSDFGGLVALDRWVAVAAPPYAELLSLPASDPASASTAASASTGSSGSATSSASTGASASTMASVGTAASAGTMTSVGTAASAGTMAGAGTAVSAGTASAGTASVGVGAAGGLGSAWAPIRVDGVDLLDDDRLALRRILDGRHDAHARVVNQTLATEPGLRVAALTAPELAAGLIAVRAYCATERESINNVLRGIAAPTADATVLARCVAYGLRRLPTAFGAVFRTATALPVTNYRTGMVLVEPAFLDVNRSPQPDSGREAAGDPVTTAGDPATAAGDPATATGDPATAAGGQVTAAGDLAAEAEFVIWSASARRIGSLAVQASATDPEAGGAPAAVFPAGTVFTVLAVDPPEQDNRWRIYLRELPDGRPIAGGDQVLERLRDALAAGAESTGPDPAASPALTIAPGLDAGGQPFAPRAPEPPAARPGGQRGAGGRGGVARGRRQRGAR